MALRWVCSASFVAALILAACSAAGTSFEDIDALASSLRAKGLECDGLKQADINPKGEGLPSGSGVCTIDGEGVQLFTFPSARDASLWFEDGKMETVSTARGMNWVIVTQTNDVAEAIADALGGENGRYQ
jgi:hypothetical protein